MLAKFHPSIRILAAIGLSGLWFNAVANPWDQSPVGSCYSSIEKYAADKFGATYKEDENIKIWPLRQIGVLNRAFKFIWVVDMTPSKNWSWVLLRQDATKACAILLGVTSTSISLEYIKDGKLPTYVTTDEQVSQGWATRVIYRLDKASQNYYPYQCYKVIGERKRRAIDCKNAFD